MYQSTTRNTAKLVIIINRGNIFKQLTHDMFLVSDWQWLHTFSMVVKTAEALIKRTALPARFVSHIKFPQRTFHDAYFYKRCLIAFSSEEGIKPDPYNQTHWNLQADQEIMAWVTQQPGDWQIGGNCQAFLWGSGKHGQLAEAGKIQN
jgi:E3 ubiquitin-protein ligase HERC1